MCTAEKESNTIKSFESREGKMSLSQVLLGDSGESSVFLYVYTAWRHRTISPQHLFMLASVAIFLFKAFRVSTLFNTSLLRNSAAQHSMPSQQIVPVILQ